MCGRAGVRERTDEAGRGRAPARVRRVLFASPGPGPKFRQGGKNMMKNREETTRTRRKNSVFAPRRRLHRSRADGLFAAVVQRLRRARRACRAAARRRLGCSARDARDHRAAHCASVAGGRRAAFARCQSFCGSCLRCLGAAPHARAPRVPPHHPDGRRHAAQRAARRPGAPRQRARASATNQLVRRERPVFLFFL